MASLPSRYAWRTVTACASRRTAVPRMQSGPFEVSSSLHQLQGTKHAGGIRLFSASCIHTLDHVRRLSRTSGGSSLLPLVYPETSIDTSSRGINSMASPPLLLTYASTSRWPLANDPTSSTSNPLRIAILDSSFNPPSRAHYALATYTPQAFDAHLLLLSSKNVDKVPGPGDTSLEDRIAMMEIMAKHMQAESPKSFPKVAVGSLAAATFAEKAPIIQDYLDASAVHIAEQQYTLIFFIGFDTVTRLFMPKYYDNSEKRMHEVLEKFFIQDKCEVICAKRPVENVAQQDVADQEEESFFKRPEVSKYVEIGKLNLVDIEGTVGISSTKIRQALKRLNSGNSGDSEKQLRSLILDDILQYCMQKKLYAS